MRDQRRPLKRLIAHARADDLPIFRFNAHIAVGRAEQHLLAAVDRVQIDRAFCNVGSIAAQRLIIQHHKPQRHERLSRFSAGFAANALVGFSRLPPNLNHPFIAGVEIVIELRIVLRMRAPQQLLLAQKIAVCVQIGVREVARRAVRYPADIGRTPFPRFFDAGERFNLRNITGAERAVGQHGVIAVGSGVVHIEIRAEGRVRADDLIAHLAEQAERAEHTNEHQAGQRARAQRPERMQPVLPPCDQTRGLIAASALHAAHAPQERRIAQHAHGQSPGRAPQRHKRRDDNARHRHERDGHKDHRLNIERNQAWKRAAHPPHGQTGAGQRHGRHDQRDEPRLPPEYTANLPPGGSDGAQHTDLLGLARELTLHRAGDAHAAGQQQRAAQERQHDKQRCYLFIRKAIVPREEPAADSQPAEIGQADQEGRCQMAVLIEIACQRLFERHASFERHDALRDDAPAGERRFLLRNQRRGQRAKTCL